MVDAQNTTGCGQLCDAVRYRARTVQRATVQGDVQVIARRKLIYQLDLIHGRNRKQVGGNITTLTNDRAGLLAALAQGQSQRRCRTYCISIGPQMCNDADTAGLDQRIYCSFVVGP